MKKPLYIPAEECDFGRQFNEDGVKLADELKNAIQPIILDYYRKGFDSVHIESILLFSMVNINSRSMLEYEIEKDQENEKDKSKAKSKKK